MKSLFAVIALLATFACLAAGCAKKEADAPAAGTAAPGAGSAAATTATPEQEAAKQRAIQQGPGIEAAINASQQGK